MRRPRKNKMTHHVRTTALSVGSLAGWQDAHYVFQVSAKWADCLITELLVFIAVSNGIRTKINK